MACALPGEPDKMENRGGKGKESAPQQPGWGWGPPPMAWGPPPPPPPPPMPLVIPVPIPMYRQAPPAYAPQPAYAPPAYAPAPSYAPPAAPAYCKLYYRYKFYLFILKFVF